jgi:hypothetical protein
MSEPVRAAVALVAFVAAYLIGILAYLVVSPLLNLGADLESGNNLRSALIPIGLLWIALGWTVARWWVLAIPIVPYAAYMMAGDVHYGPDAIRLEELLVLGVVTLAVGVAARTRLGPD